MPVDKQKLLRFSVLNDCFRNKNVRYTIDDLVEVCNRAIDRKLDMKPVSKRTIQNDISEMEKEPYSIVLDDTLREGHRRIYRYLDTNDSINLFNVTDDERDRIQGAIEVLKRFGQIPQYDWVRFCLQKIAEEQFMKENRPIISFQNNPDLWGTEHIERLMEAIFNRQPLLLTYKPYDRFEDGMMVAREESEHRIYPYFLKQYNNRWFLIGRVQNYDSITVFALDRIRSIRNLNIRYVDAGIDFDDYFKDTVGVTVRQDVEEVLLRVHKRRYQYIKTKPLHNSQREIPTLETATHVTLRLKTHINNELETLLLSFSSDIEVLGPQRLRDSIAARVKEMAEFYKL